MRDDRPLGLAVVRAKEDEGHLVELDEVGAIDEAVVGDDVPTHPGILRAEVVNLAVLALNVLKGRGAGRPEGVVLLEDVMVEDVDSADRRLGHEVQHVRNGAPPPEDGHAVVLQLGVEPGELAVERLSATSRNTAGGG